MASLKSYNDRKKRTHLVDLIDKKGDTEGYPRHYIGMSGLGGCSRALWFNFKWVLKGKIAGRTNRIFATGHKAEEMMIESLESIGIKCWNTLDDQYEFVDAHGYSIGHPDGFCNNVPGNEEEEYLVEFKTMNDKSFKDTVKKKVKESKPVYYSQMALYMYKKGLSKALFMAINKNDSSYYIEIVPSDNGYAKELISKAHDIVFCEDFNILPRIGNDSPSWYECKWCNYNDICFGNDKVKEFNCRTCNNLDLIGDGKFGCGLNDKVLNLEDQLKGCEEYTILECFK